MKSFGIQTAVILVLVLLVGLFCGLLPGAAADNATVNLELTDVDARAAIKMLFQSTGKNYAIDSDVSGTIPSVVLRDLPFDQALRSLLRSAGLVHRMDGDVYIISKKPEVTAPTAGAPAPGTEVIPEQTATEETQIEKIPLNNVGASEILSMISGSGSGGGSMFGSYGNMGNMGSWGGLNTSFGSNFGGSNFGSSFGSNFGGSNFGGSNFGGSNFGSRSSSFGGSSYGSGFNRSW